MKNINLIIGFSNIIVGLTLALTCFPLLFNKIKPNKLYGFRLKKSYSSDANWYKINKYGAKSLIIWSIPIIIIGIITFFVSIKINTISYFILTFQFLIFIILSLIDFFVYYKKL